MNVPVSLHRFGTSSCSPRPAEPVTFGVPMPRGAALDAGTWHLLHGGHRRPVATTALDHWSDGSVRWMLVDAQVLNTDGSPTEAHLVSGAAGDESDHATLQVSVRSDGVSVDSGCIVAEFRAGGAFPISGVTVAGERVFDPATSGLTVTDASDRAVTVRTTGATVEHSSDLRVRVRVTAEAVIAGNRRIAFVARVDLFAGLPTVSIRCTVLNPDRARHPGNFWDLGDPGSVLIKDLSLALTWPSSRSAAVSISTDVSEAMRPVEQPLELYQDSSGGDCWQSTNHINRQRRVPNSFRGYRLRSGDANSSGLRATPLMSVAAPEATLTVAMPGFWQNFPRALESADRGVTVRFFPAQYDDLHELQGGEQKTHECFLAFEAPGTASSFEWLRAPTVASVDPDWVIASNAVDGLAALDAGHRALVDQAIAGPDSFEKKREIIDQFGWRHFGEIYGDHEALGHAGASPLVSHYNNQYDPVLGFALQYLRTGDVRWRRAMDELADHVIDIDIYHTDRDKAAYNGGLFWHTYHYGDADTATHRTYPKRNTGKVFGGGPSADHNYPTGLMLRYFLTGDRASRDAAVGLAQYVLNLDDGRLSPFRILSRADTGRAIYTPPGYYGPARSSGNSLNALVDGHRLTGEDRFIDKADQLVRRVVHPDDVPANNRLDEPEFRWFYAMFLQSLGKYLVHKAERGLIDDAYAYGRASLLTYARWMAEHEYPYLEKPEKLEFPTETWAAQDIRKSDIFYYAALHAAGAERERFLERAAFFHRTSIATLTAMPTRVFARPVIVLLTSGILHSWFDGRRDVTLPTPRNGVQFGSPQVFVSQRAIAERRARLIVAVGAAGMLAAATLVMWWLW